ncbi:rRNA maturation RNase YbeY [Oceanicoccus sp. KOV_DT_Chl]|uniref:rRNA maturation RNase YbeY n=1 Tax=Oceanicoccus sp. KOV_DT_Chl TaxID=1904639 RepID=UPI002100AC93|nr:rRNA maturation RNase YbeY [Oceanicoccus sp. KOV_DT_Chl]
MGSKTPNDRATGSANRSGRRRPPSPAKLQQWVELAIAKHKTEAELTIRLVNETEISQLNNTYRGKDKSTNVLSFPADLPEFIELPLLGDLVICSSIVAQEAHEQNKVSEHHWAHMVIHGTLHLLGYDHVEEHDAVIMEALEIELLASLNIANPYLDTAYINNTATNL